MYCIILKGQGDQTIFFVEEDLWDWIHSDPMPGAISWFEPWPNRLQEAIKESPKGARISIGSYENDRALQVSIYVNVPFNVAEDVDMQEEINQWCVDNNVTIVDYYYGYIY